MKFIALLALLCVMAYPCLADETESVETIVSSVVRREGYKCEKPIKATKDVEDSIPEEMAWILKCKNATYKVQLLPHYLSAVEVIEATE